MAKIEHAYDWMPSSKAEADAWMDTDSISMMKIAKSSFANESVIRAMATYSWGSNDGDNFILPALLENPNLTPQLREVLDANSRTWCYETAVNYWISRYSIDAPSSNRERYDGKSKPVSQSFSEALLSSKLSFEDSARAVLEIADQFAEQMWRDLAVQKHCSLEYWEEGGYLDKFFPVFTAAAQSGSEVLNEDLIEILSPGEWVTWVELSNSISFDYLRGGAENFDGQFHFDERDYLDYLNDGPYSATSLGFAIGAGVENGDLEVVDQDGYKTYLLSAYENTDPGVDCEVTVSGDSPWTGVRYRELSEDQQMNLVINLLTTLKHPYLGRPDGASRHFLNCIALHDDTGENVKASLLIALTD